MAKDKILETLAKHLAADVNLKPIFINGDDPKDYTNKMTNLTQIGAIFLQKGKDIIAATYFLNAHIQKVNDFWASYYLGSMALEVDDPARAHYYLKACLEDAPKDWSVLPIVLTNLASSQFKLGDFSGAESNLEKAIGMNPKLDRSYYMKSIHNIYMNNLKHAMEITKEGLRRSPDSYLLKHLELRIQEIMENSESN